MAVEAWQEAFAKGARPVVIQYPGLNQPLFGLLKLCAINASDAGPWQREYLIQIPQSYVDQTDQSRMSVVYEIYPPGRAPRGYAWVLWLSRLPVFNAPAAVGGAGAGVPGAAPPAASPSRERPSARWGRRTARCSSSPGPGGGDLGGWNPAGEPDLKLLLVGGEPLIKAACPNGPSKVQSQGPARPNTALT